MSLGTWRSPLARALHLNRSLVYARYFQLATIANDGYPANRTVVFRGFLEETNQIQIITDSRSQKAHQVKNFSQGEICWYFPKSREQFRFRGDLTLVTGDDLKFQSARQKMWQDISPSARSQFRWPRPGEIIDQEIEKGTIKPEKENTTCQANSEVAEASKPAANFCLLLFDPLQVDHLELRASPQSRHQHAWNGTCWIVTAINP